MYVTTARFETQHASKYLQQLCKHFAHKVEVAYDDRQGHAALPPGRAEMRAEDGALTIRLESEDVRNMIHARFVIDSHLATFAHREGFTGLNWSVETADRPG